MGKEADSHAAEDKDRREQIDRRNRLDAMVYEVEKNSKEWADRLDGANRDRLNKALEGAREALRTGAPDGVKSALDELSQAYSAAGASLYEAARAQNAESGGTGETKTEPPKQDDVVEADYEVVDDNKS